MKTYTLVLNLFFYTVNNNFLNKKFILFFALVYGLLFSSTVTAQTTFDAFPEVDFIQQRGLSTLDLVDVDNDGDLDLILTGRDISFNTTLYINNGEGLFVELIDAFSSGVENGDVEAGDIDGDGDFDLLIMGGQLGAGLVDPNAPILYRNDGLGNFTPITNSNVVGTSNGEGKFGDIDNDNDLDLLVVGTGPDGTGANALYLNDGTGSFTVVPGSPFTGGGYSEIEFLDVDGDLDLDVLLLGGTIHLYLNDGSGDYVLDATASFPSFGSQLTNFAVSDLDGDGDLDIFANSVLTTNAFFNDGNGNFSVLAGNAFPWSFGPDVALGDVDGDGDIDIQVVGQIDGTTSNSELYLNDGGGLFTTATYKIFDGFPFDPRAEMKFGDVNGDGMLDLFADRGVNQSSIGRFINRGQGVFVEQVNITPIQNGNAVFADFNNDTLIDVVVAGGSPVNNDQTVGLFLKTSPLGPFGELNSVLPPVTEASVAVADVDSDGDLDILISGRSSGILLTQLYLNDGNANFSLSPNSNFVGLFQSSIDFADVDGDGDLDVLIAGTNSILQGQSDLYFNDGNGVFTLSTNTLGGTRNSKAEFGDLDNDNDLDLIIAGRNTNVSSTRLYVNDGTGQFTELIVPSLPNISLTDVGIADLNADGNNDVVISGIVSGQTITSVKVLLNDGMINFTELAPMLFGGGRLSAIALTDIDNDGDIDVFCSGDEQGIGGDFITRFYENDGAANFTENTNHGLDGIRRGSIDVADIDGDGDKDLLIVGQSDFVAGNGTPFAQIYLNNQNCLAADTPQVTTSSVVLCSGDSVALEIAGNLNAADQWYIYTEACGGTLVGTTPSNSFIVNPLQTTTYYVRGEGGSCFSDCTTFTVTIEDNTPPELFCPGDITMTADQNLCSAVVNFGVVGIDNCNIAGPTLPGFTRVGIFEGSTFYLSDGFFTGQNAFNDAFSNGGYVATIDNAEENEFLRTFINSLGTFLEVLIGYNDVETEGSFVWANGSPSTYTNWSPGEPNDFNMNEDYTTMRPNGAWNDNSQSLFRYFLEIKGGIEQTAGLASGSVFPVGTTPIEFTAIDVNGNSTTCMFNITVNDNEPPFLECQEDSITVEVEEGEQFEVPDYFAMGEGIVSITDNCTSVANMIITQDPIPGTLLDIGTYTIIFTAEDESGNAFSCGIEQNVEESTSLGINDNAFGESIFLYPNPTTDSFVIRNKNNVQLSNLKIYDLNGRLINNINLTQIEEYITVDISQLTSGIYFVQVESFNASTIKKLIVE